MKFNLLLKIRSVNSLTWPLRRKNGASMDKSDFKNEPDYAYFVIPTYYCYKDDEVPSYKMPYIEDVKDEDDVDTYDQYVGAYVMVLIGADNHSGKVVRIN
jgi:hypothetical protein